MNDNNKASHNSGTKVLRPWAPLAFVAVGGFMLVLEAPYVTPPLEALRPVSCGIPQALKSIHRGGYDIICASGKEIIFTGGLSSIYRVLRRCVDEHQSVDIWPYKQPRAGSTYLLQARCNNQIVLPYSEGVDGYRTAVWLHIVFSCAAIVGGAVILGTRYRRRFRHQGTLDHR